MRRSAPAYPDAELVLDLAQGWFLATTQLSIRGQASHHSANDDVVLIRNPQYGGKAYWLLLTGSMPTSPSPPQPPPPRALTVSSRAHVIPTARRAPLRQRHAPATACAPPRRPSRPARPRAGRLRRRPRPCASPRSDAVDATGSARSPRALAAAAPPGRSRPATPPLLRLACTNPSARRRPLLGMFAATPAPGSSATCVMPR